MIINCYFFFCFKKKKNLNQGGGEDDDLATRIKHNGYRIVRYKPHIARYTMLRHKKETPNPER